MEFLLQKDVFSEDEFEDTQTIIGKYFPNITIITDEEIFGKEKKWSSEFKGHFRGSLALASQLKRKFPYAEATNWAPAFQDKLVSEDYLFLDAQGILSRNPLPWPTFIRPSSGNKSFSGNVFSLESFQKEFTFLTRNKNQNPGTR